jgi:RyR domain
MENTHDPQKVVVTGDVTEGEVLEELAEAAHEVFCQRLRSEGYTYGPQTDDKQKTHSSLMAYAKLPEDEKKQNRSNVQDIPNKLARVGYIMIPARSKEASVGFPPSIVEQLAEMEHERWVKTKVEAGWRWAPETEKDKKLHKDLLPWHRLSDEERSRLNTPAEAAALGVEELPDEEKEKDRVMVRGIPQILAKAGYTIVEV